MNDMRKLIKIIENIENEHSGPISQADEFAKAAFAAGIKLGNEGQYDSGGYIRYGGYDQEDISSAYEQWKKDHAKGLDVHSDSIEEGSTDIRYPNYEDHEKEMLHRLNWLQARMEEQLDWIRQVKVNKRQRNPEPEEIAQTAIGLIKFLKKNSPD